MGNCMETNKEKGMERGEKGINDDGEKGGMEILCKEGDFVKDVKNNKNGLRVKMVLTKEELQWLMMHLKDKENSGKRIEDVLGEIENGRNKKVGGHVWRPSLDSITEIPELLEMNR